MAAFVPHYLQGTLSRGPIYPQTEILPKAQVEYYVTVLFKMNTKQIMPYPSNTHHTAHCLAHITTLH